MFATPCFLGQTGKQVGPSEASSTQPIPQLTGEKRSQELTLGLVVSCVEGEVRDGVSSAGDSAR